MSEEIDNLVYDYGVCEMFRSIQGEGPNMGKPCTFIRFSGCNLRCPWCDSKYAWPVDKMMLTVAQILKSPSVKKHKHIVLTGGEPMMRNLEPLLVELARHNHSVEIETNGTYWSSPVSKFANIVVSPKLTVEGGINPVAIDQFVRAGGITFKFVVSSTDEIDQVYEFCENYQVKSGAKIYLMPEGITRKVILERLQLIACYVRDMYPNWDVKISPRLHILLWGNKRGK